MFFAKQYLTLATATQDLITNFMIIYLQQTKLLTNHTNPEYINFCKSFNMQRALAYILVVWNLRTDNRTKGCLEGKNPVFRALKSKV